MLPLSFGWRHLLFANWPVESDVLRAHLPDTFAVEEFGGTGWLTVVPLAVPSSVHRRVSSFHSAPAFFMSVWIEV